MRVALVICPQVNADKPPLSLAYLSAYLSTKGVEVACFDLNIDLYDRCNSENKHLWESALETEWIEERRFNGMGLIDHSVIQNWIEQIEGYSPEIIGFSLLSTNYHATFRLIKEIRVRNKNVKIVLGGPETYRLFGLGNQQIFTYVNALILGEGEESFYYFISNRDNSEKLSSHDGIVVNNNGVLMGGGQSHLIENIDNLNFPRYDLFPLHKYKEKGQLPLVFSRGCIGRCSFCFERAFWGVFRSRSVENLIAEIKFMREQYGIWCFALNDSLLNGDMNFLSEFCDKVIQDNIEVAWWGMARINSHMTKDFLEKMVKAGCKHIAYGVESGSQRVLNLMHKGYTVPMIGEVIMNTWRAGIKPGINLMVGLPGEEEEDFRETCELVRRNGNYISYVNISTLGIEPFTEVYANRKILGLNFYDSVNWSTHDHKNNPRVRSERAMRLSHVVNEYVGKAINFADQKKPISSA